MAWESSGDVCKSMAGMAGAADWRTGAGEEWPCITPAQAGWSPRKALRENGKNAASRRNEREQASRGERLASRPGARAHAGEENQCPNHEKRREGQANRPGPRLAAGLPLLGQWPGLLAWASWAKI